MIDRAAPIFTEQTSWWAPRRRGWWLAVLFIVGSLCFAVGSFPPTAAILGAAAGPYVDNGSLADRQGAVAETFLVAWRRIKDVPEGESALP